MEKSPPVSSITALLHQYLRPMSGMIFDRKNHPQPAAVHARAAATKT
jgi:hypothetical protein